MSYTAQVILAYITRYKQAHDGIAPTIREIGDACGVCSTSNVAYYLDKLEAEGSIRRGDSGSSRFIEVVGGAWIAPKEAGA